MTQLLNYQAEYSAKNNGSPYAISAGGVVYKFIDNAILYHLLIRNDVPVTYHLPKGTVRIDETLEDCARREIREETGCETHLTAYLGATTNQFTLKGTYFDKTTHYFAAKYIKSVASMDNEHDDSDWCSFDDAMAKLGEGAKQEQIFLERCASYINFVAP